MKKITAVFLLLCMSIVGLKAQTAPTSSNGFPIRLSANTTDKAAWYYIKYSNTAGTETGYWAVSKTLATGSDQLKIKWGSPTNAEEHMFCFIGDGANGVKIYSKAYLNGKTIGAVTLDKDLALQNFTAVDFASGGFTTSTALTGADLLNQWFFEEGDGKSKSGGGTAATGLYLIHNANKTRAWWKSGGALLQIGAVVTWGAAYQNQFQWVEGQGDYEPVPTGEPANSSGFPFKLSDNTSDLAAWYTIGYSNASGTEKGYWAAHKTFTSDVDRLEVKWGTPTNADEQLYCFIGDKTGGVKIYNKAYLKDNVIGGVTLSKDLEFQNFTTAEYAPGGFATNSTLTGTDLINKWLFEEGDGLAKPGGGVAATGLYLIHNAAKTKGWWKSGSAFIEVGPVVTWGGAYCNIFTWVEGQGGTNLPTGIEGGITPTNFRYYVQDHSLILENAEGIITLTSILGSSQKIRSTGSVMSIPLNAAGVYVLTVEGVSYKVLVK